MPEKEKEGNEIEWPKWLRVGCWLVALLLVVVLLAIRLDDISSGEASNIECLLLASVLALILVPLFKDIDVFGFRLRQEINSVREHVDRQVSHLRAEANLTAQQSSQQIVTVNQKDDRERDEDVRRSEEGAVQPPDEPKSAPEGQEPDAQRLARELPNYAGTVLVLLREEVGVRGCMWLSEFEAALIGWRPAAARDWSTRVTFAVMWLQYYGLVTIREGHIHMTELGREVADLRFPGHT